MRELTIGAATHLQLKDVIAIARYPHQVTLSQDALRLMNLSYDFLQAEVKKRVPIYGINTNFGDQVNFIDLPEDDNLYQQMINARQVNIINSLTCSLGTEVDSEIVKATLLLRAHCLAQGHSGVQPAAAFALTNHLNAGITPIIYCYGSIGASGDLIPLGTIGASLLGLEVNVRYKNTIMPAKKALKEANLSPFKPTIRDGLAIINGTSFMTAIASLAVYDLNQLFPQMLTSIAMALEAMQVHSSAYHAFVHQLKNQAGEKHVAAYLLNCWQDSQLITDDKTAESSANKRVQDYYSLRAVAQGFGPFYETLNQAIIWIENEINSVNDNPVIDAEKRQIYHSANFMGYYITSACDNLKMDISQASTWLHALLANLVHARKNQGLPTNIVNQPGKNNGFRSMQLLSAALAVQNRKFAQSHQAFMLPTEGDNQDVNSLGTHAALDLREAVKNLERLTAIILLAACQGLELRGLEKASPQSCRIVKKTRQISSHIETCRPMTEEINLVIAALKEGVIMC